jgi:hypothetical protein
VQLKTAIFAHGFDEPFHFFVAGGLRKELSDLEVEAFGVGDNFFLQLSQLSVWVCVFVCVCVCVSVCASFCACVRL